MNHAETAIAEIKPQPAMSWSQEQVNLIKQTVAKNATDMELSLFLHQCKRTGLDPLGKQIYFQKRQNKTTGEWTVVFITSIDGFRLTAARTGEHIGTDDAVFVQEPGIQYPGSAKVTVYRLVKGQKASFTATARWDEYYPQEERAGKMWRKMPYTMLGKCAEALALRKGFPNELSGLYGKEEMDQAGEPAPDYSRHSEQVPPVPSHPYDDATHLRPSPAPQGYDQLQDYPPPQPTQNRPAESGALNGRSPNSQTGSYPTTNEPATERQRGMVFARMTNELGMNDDAYRHDFLMQIVGKTSFKELTKADIQNLVVAIEEEKQRQVK